MNAETFEVRRAKKEDAATIARHRAMMFKEMGQASGEVFETLRAASEGWLTGALESGEYVGWLAVANNSAGEIIGGAGIQRRQVAPHPRPTRDGGFVLAEGRHAIVLNVFTEPAWRRRGVARMLMRALLAWAREEKLDRLVLHATADGRALYQQLGFAPTNEMRYTDDLSSRPNET